MEGRLFTLDAQFLFDAVILALSMLVLFTALSFLLFNPVRDLLKKRKQRITEEQETAQREREQAVSFKEEYDKKLKEVDKEAEEILSATRKKAKKNETKIVAEAKEEANRIIARANAEVELEKKRSMDDMKQEVITIATMMAEKMVVSSIDVDTHERLVEETLEEMGENTWQN